MTKVSRSGELLEKQSRIAKALDDLTASHRRLEITTTNGVGQLRRDILDSLNQLRAHDCNPSPTSEQRLMKYLTSLLSALPREAGTLSRNLLVIKSLCFPSMEERESCVRKAHPKTFDWLFEEKESNGNANGEDPTVSMLDWLRTYNGVFWISGKAGSGKSTLMKYFYNHRKTLTALRAWAGNKQLFTAHFFFWHAGTEMQKSQQGLLRTLLYHMLRQCPSLARKVCPSQWHDADLADCTWTLPRLLDTFNELKRQTIDSARFCFFVDGLDEYEGNHSEIIEIIDSFSSSSDVKVCIASRAWNVFENAYGDNFDRKMRLQDLTWLDIKRFVTDELEENRYFRELRASDNRCEDLVTEIVDRADGVFPWVFLVVHSLRRGLTNADTVPELQDRLRILPTDLEEYFQHMLDSVEKVYHRQSARLFLMRLAAPATLTMMTVSYFDKEDPDFGLAPEVEAPSPTEVKDKQRRTLRRVKARCTDLLEISKDYNVHFLHRTVHDFLEIPRIQKLLIERAGPNFHVHEYFCNAMLSQMKLLPLEVWEEELDVLIDDLLCHICQNESRGASANCRFIEEMKRLVEAFGRCASPNFGTKWACMLQERYRERWVDALAIQYGLYSYVFKETGHMKTPIETGVKPSLPLSLQLLLALQLADNCYLRQGSTVSNAEIESQTINLLLEHGVNPNESFEGGPAWLRFLQNIPQEVSSEIRWTYVLVTEMLFLHGAKLSSSVDVKDLDSLLSKFCTPDEEEYLKGLLPAQRRAWKVRKPSLGKGNWSQKSLPLLELQILTCAGYTQSPQDGELGEGSRDSLLRISM